MAELTLEARVTVLEAVVAQMQLEMYQAYRRRDPARFDADELGLDPDDDDEEM